MDKKMIERARRIGILDSPGQSAALSRVLAGSVPKKKPAGCPLPVGWLGWYTKKGGERWFSCEVIAHDGGQPVIKTATGRYHRRPIGEYEYTDRQPKNVGR